MFDVNDTEIFDKEMHIRLPMRRFLTNEQSTPQSELRILFFVQSRI